MAAPKQETDDALLVDNGGLAPARHFCPHVVDSISLPTQSLVFPDLSQNIKCSVSKCDCTDSNGYWICLCCYQIYCGRYGNKHMIEHKSNKDNHCVALCCGDLSFWCYICDDYLDHLSIEKVFKMYQVAHKAKFKEPIPNLNKLMKRCNFKQQQLFMKYLQMKNVDDEHNINSEDSKENKTNDNDKQSNDNKNDNDNKTDDNDDNDDNNADNKNKKKMRNPLANPLDKKRYGGTTGASTALSDEQIKEHFDTDDIIQKQAIQCAEMIKNAKHVTVYTGAGISTAANIPDYRGPKGVWTLANKGISRSKNDKTVALENAIPTYSHLALVEMSKNNFLHYVISTNVDGLHRRSGIEEKNISELHGNIYIEFCNECGTEYMRPFKVKGQIARKKKYNKQSRRFTGRLCDDTNCDGQLRDSIIGFGENLPENEFIEAIKHSANSDVVIVIESSMTVTPANDLPSLSYFQGGKFILVNLQKTNYDKFANVRVFAKCDEFMRLLCKELSIDVKPFDKQKESEIIEKHQKQIEKVVRIDPDF